MTEAKRSPMPTETESRAIIEHARRLRADAFRRWTTAARTRFGALVGSRGNGTPAARA